MRRTEHPFAPDIATCERVATIVLRRRGGAWDRAQHSMIVLALMLGKRFDEKGEEIE